MNDLLDFACHMAMQAGEKIKKSSGRIETVEFKGVVDLVTDIDRKAQKIITENIQKKFPDHGITAEEQFESLQNSDYRWIIDPLDGTTNFVHGYPFYCVSIALKYKGEVVLGVVYNPCLNEMFKAKKGGGAFLGARSVQVSKNHEFSQALIATGFSYAMREKKYCLDTYMDIFQGVMDKVQGIRRDGSAALDLCSVACGRLDGFFEEGLKEWDTAAGVLIVKEAGGKVTDFFGCESSGISRTIVASNNLVHQDMLKITKKFSWCDPQK